VLGETEGTQRVQAEVLGGMPLVTAFTASAGAGIAARVELVGGNGQTATAGSTLPESLVVRTLDEENRPVAGIAVAWAAAGGGSASAATTVTGPDGTTGIRWTLGPTAGEQGATATVEGSEGSPVAFTATASVGEAGRLAIQVQPATTSQSGAPFSRQPQVQLVDDNDNPVARDGLAVTAELASGPGGATLIGSATASTNSQGLAVFNNLGISGAAGTYRLNFIGANVSGALSNSIIVSAGAASAVAIVTQPATSAESGVVLDRQPKVRLVDQIGNPVGRSGVVVTAGISSGGGTLSGATSAQTNSDGVADFTNLAITGSGSHTLIFASSGLASVVSGTIQVRSVPSAANSSITGPATLPAGENGTVQVTLRDQNDMPVPGVAVTLSVSGDDAGVTVTPGSAITNGSGVAAFTVRITEAGKRSITANGGEISLGPIDIEILPGPPSAAQTTAEVPDGRRLRSTDMKVTVRDAFGNRIHTGGASVTGAITDGPNTGSSIDVDDEGDGTYELSYFPFFSGFDEIEIRLGGQPIAGSPFQSRVRN